MSLLSAATAVAVLWVRELKWRLRQAGWLPVVLKRLATKAAMVVVAAVWAGLVRLAGEHCSHSEVVAATQFGEGGDGNLDGDGCAGALADGSTSAAVADVVVVGGGTGGGGGAVGGGGVRETKLQARVEPRVETKVGLEVA